MSVFKEFTKGFWKENPVLVLVLGMCPTLATSSDAVKGLAMGLATTFVLMGSNLVISVIRKLVPDGPHEVLLVLDGSTGQNAFEQAKQFTSATEVTSMTITKLDGSAKGGVVIGISDQFKIPVRYIGLGERAEDLQPFNRREFVDSLFKKTP